MTRHKAWSCSVLLCCICGANESGVDLGPGRGIRAVPFVGEEHSIGLVVPDDGGLARLDTHPSHALVVRVSGGHRHHLEVVLGLLFMLFVNLLQRCFERG